MKYVKVSGIFVSTNATLTLSQAFTPSEWWPYFSLLVVSEEYTLDNIYMGRIVCLGTLCIVLGPKHPKE